jgi:hypothetical protein
MGRMADRLNQPGLVTQRSKASPQMSSPSDPRPSPMGAVELLNRLNAAMLEVPNHRRSRLELLEADIRRRGIEGFGPISGSIGPWVNPPEYGGPSSGPPPPPLGGHMPPRP